jgi:hypothetical protein
VQVAPDGVVIATQLLRQHSALNWETTLRHWLKLKRHAKAPDGGDICNYRVGEGEVLKGIYLTDARLLFGANVPPVNPRLRVVE